MARCPNCGSEVPANAKYCPHCGVALSQRRPSPEQPPLPFSPWGPPHMAPATAGAGAGETARTEPLVGPPLTARQVGIAIGAILLFLIVMILIGRGGKHSGTTTTPAKSLPVIGMMGESVNVGNTTWGVAFTDHADRIGNQTSHNGQFYAVGVVIGNKGNESITLSRSTAALIDEGTGKRSTPYMTAWGTPDDIREGRYTTEYTLPAHEAIAGLVIFDIPVSLQKPRLLIRDLTTSSTEYTAEIDLTKEKQPSSE